MNVYDNLEEFSDPPNDEIEEGENSASRIAFYCDLAKTVGGPVLEIACGSGLVALPIAAQGMEVIGVDLAIQLLRHPGIMHAKAFCNSIAHHTDWPQPEEGTWQRIHEGSVWNWRKGTLSLAER